MLRKIYREFFCIPKYIKTTNKRLRVQMGLLVLSMIVCCTAFCATTFAWFTAQHGAKVEPIVAAEYSVQISIDGSVIDSNEYTFNLEESDQHTVIITANGTATFGYVVIYVGGNTYSTQQISKGQSITITITAAQGEQIRFEAFWGENLSQSALCNESTLYISQTPYVTYTVAEGVTLAQISEYYGVSKEDILRYNGITELIARQEIKIPNTSVTTPLVIKQAEGNEGSTPQPSEGNGSSTTEGDTPPVNTEAQAPATGTGEAANPGTPSTPSVPETSGDDTTTSTSTETTVQESKEDVETQAQQNLVTEVIVETE